jgi:hypothetical protein
MHRSVIFTPEDRYIDRSLDARGYMERLAERVELVIRNYSEGETWTPDDFDSAAVLVGLSGLELDSGYMEPEIDTIFRPQHLLTVLRGRVPGDFPIVAVVDDAYSDYIMKSCLKAGASAVVGSSGALFGLVKSRLRSWDELLPYMNAFDSA